MEKVDKGFTVKDRRQAEQHASPEQTNESPDASGASAVSSGRERHQGTPGQLAEIDFATFVLSLATSAQISMGSIPHPETNQTSQDIPAAKQMIDIIIMLQQKTEGNLSKEEEGLLEQVLFNLRMHYVRIAEGQKKSGGS